MKQGPHIWQEELGALHDNAGTSMRKAESKGRFWRRKYQ